MEQSTPSALLLEQLLDIGTSLSSEANLDALLEKILQAAKQITQADGGTLYLVAPGNKHLQFRIVHNDTLGICYRGHSGIPLDSHFRDIPLYRETGEQNLTTVAACAALTGKTINIEDAYSADGFDFSGTRLFDLKSGYRSRSFLTVPMKNHEGELVGVLQLINAHRLNAQNRNTVTEFTAQDQRLTESLASQAAIALSNRRLIEQLKSLFEAMILMINKAIEDKSKYTGGHCERVPQLTLMLADALSNQTEGTYADFHLDDSARYELRIASLLHDCGKLVTPVHVVDKSTKLESIFDRIELIDTRIELIKREAEIQLLRKQLTHPCTEAEASANQIKHQALIDQLNADGEFLRRCNFDGQKMSEEDIAKIKSISSQYAWTSAKGEKLPLLTQNEIENLSIRSGTLTDAERDIINYHINATINMLEALPWPIQLSRVPAIAGGHHERMDGKGYPKGLTGEQLSIQARMLAIADVFEALTACDRPYKKPMSLSQALKVMENFARNGHIDPDIYQLFLENGVHLKYAEAFLLPEQIDI